MPGVVEATVYKVETLYVTRDEASRGLHDIASAAHGAHSATSLLKEGLAALGVGIGIEKAKHAFIDFNSSVENAKISLSTMLQGNYAVDWDTATQGANRLYSEFQRFSQLTPVTTQEMLEFGRGVTVATAQAGGSIKDITTITEQGVVAAKALGMESNYASLELTEMLMGNVSRRMRFAQQILGFAKMDEKEFKALSAGQRMNVIEKVLTSPAMKNATEAFSHSWSGVLSTLEDKLQILGGKIGLPLFQAVTREVTAWNEWLDKNQAKVDQFISSVGSGLVSAFEMVKSAFAFIYDHAETFITIGKIWAAIKIGNMLGGGLGGMLGGLVGGGGALGASISGASGIAAAIGPALAAGLGGYQLGRMAGLDKVGEELGGGAVVARLHDVETASASLSNAMIEAAGTMRGGFMSSFQGVLDQREQQVAALRELVASEGRGGMFALAARAGARDKLTSAGLTPDEVEKMGGYQAALAQIEAQRSAQADRGELVGVTTQLAMTFAPLFGIAGNQLEQQQMTNQLFGKLNNYIAGGGGLFDKQLLADVIAMMTDHKDPNAAFKNQAKVNQNITNHIQVEVSAKDPDRWLAELDAKVQRKIRAPSQAKGSIVTRGGL